MHPCNCGKLNGNCQLTAGNAISKNFLWLMVQSPPSPEVISYNAFNGWCVKLEHWPDVPLLLLKIVHALLTPDMVIFGATSSICEKGRH